MNILCVGPCWVKQAMKYIPRFISKCPDKHLDITMMYCSAIKLQDYCNNLDIESISVEGEDHPMFKFHCTQYKDTEFRAPVEDTIESVIQEKRFDHILFWADKHVLERKYLDRNTSLKMHVILLHNVRKYQQDAKITFVKSWMFNSPPGYYQENDELLDMYISREMDTYATLSIPVINLVKYWKSLCNSPLDNRYHNTKDFSHITQYFGEYYYSMAMFHEFFAPVLFDIEDLDYDKIFSVKSDPIKINKRFLNEGGSIIRDKLIGGNIDNLIKRVDGKFDINFRKMINEPAYLKNLARVPYEGDVKIMIDLIKNTK